MVFGKATIAADGVVLETKPGASLDLGGIERAAVIGDQGYAGATEMHKASKVTCAVILKEGMVVEDLNGLSDVTITFACDSGQKFQIVNAQRGPTPVLTGATDGGTVAMEFFGPPANPL